MKLSTIWENFDEFINICNNSNHQYVGNIKRKIDNILIDFDDNKFFQGDWEKLFHSIIEIFCDYEHYIPQTFDYTTKFLKEQKILLNPRGRNKDKTEIYRKLKEKLSLTKKLGINNKYQRFGEANKFNSESISIYSSKTVETLNPKIFEIFYIKNFKLNKMTKIYFQLKFENYEIIIYYLENKYQYSFDKETNKKVNLAIKYPEIIHYINFKFFDIKLEKLSFATFQYLLKSYCLNQISIPVLSIDNELESYHVSTYLQNTNEIKKSKIELCLEYIEKANSQNKNIIFSYALYGRGFDVIKPKHQNLKNLIQNEQNKWGKLRSANGSRKGPINNNFLK